MATEPYDPLTPSIVGPMLRLERAREHLFTLENEARTYFGREPWRISVDPKKDGDWYVLFIDEIIEWPSPRLAILASEAFHHMRASLDNLLWQLALVNAPSPYPGPSQDLQFPIYWWRKPRKANMDRRLVGITPAQRAFIEDIQPYKGWQGNEMRTALRWLAWLSNRDKHEFVNPTLGVWHPCPRVSVRAFAEGAEVIEWKFSPFDLKEGAEIARFQATVPPPHTLVQVDVSRSFDLAFGDAGLTPTGLRHMWRQVATIVDHFAPEFAPSHGSTPPAA